MLDSAQIMGALRAGGEEGKEKEVGGKGSEASSLTPPKEGSDVAYESEVSQIFTNRITMSKIHLYFKASEGTGMGKLWVFVQEEGEIGVDKLR
tara:strand:- start:338 stop:616 length:279 start_codon:yes stop_codon:yes gene_type:complete